MTLERRYALRAFALGAFFIFCGIAFGAFGAHALRDVLDQYHRDVYEKAVFYQLVNALGILAGALAGESQLVADNIVRKIPLILSAGIVFFSGSLYALAITDLRFLGAITPIGGTLFLIGWILVTLDVWKDLSGRAVK